MLGDLVFMAAFTALPLPIKMRVYNRRMTRLREGRWR